MQSGDHTKPGGVRAGRPGPPQSGWRRRGGLHLAGSAALLLAFLAYPVSLARAETAVPPGVWLMGTKVAIQIFDCSAMLCGRVVWLKAPLDPQGLLKRDTLNPDPALQERQICGPTIIWNLKPDGANGWKGGWFYNPDDGTTYQTYMKLKSQDVIVARIYLGIPIFGETRQLIRVPHGTSAGWC